MLCCVQQSVRARATEFSFRAGTRWFAVRKPGNRHRPGSSSIWAHCQSRRAILRPFGGTPKASVFFFSPIFVTVATDWQREARDVDPVHPVGLSSSKAKLIFDEHLLRTAHARRSGRVSTSSVHSGASSIGIFCTEPSNNMISACRRLIPLEFGT